MASEPTSNNESIPVKEENLLDVLDNNEINSGESNTNDGNNDDEQKKNENDGPSELDLVFCMDCTSSMSSYIEQGKRSIVSIVEKIISSEKADVRFAYIAYRDHPPQDSSFVTKIHDFTSSMSGMRNAVLSYSAQGGGDGPEAVTAALNDALNLNYRKNAAKIAVIIADAPPHGLGENGDGFPNGDPNGLDPIQIAREMAERGIVIYTVACEPALSGYNFAHDFFEGICMITEGKFLPLTAAHLLPDVIVGGAREEIALRRLEEQIENDMEELQSSNPHMTETDMADVISSRMEGRGVRSHKVEVDDIYGGYDLSNVNMISETSNLTDVRRKLKKIAQPAPRVPHVDAVVPPPAAAPTSSLFGGIFSRPSISNSLGFLRTKKSPEASEAPEAREVPIVAQNVYSTESHGLEQSHATKMVRRVQKKRGGYWGS